MDQRVLRALKTDLREWCVSSLVLHQIDDIFTKAGFGKLEGDAFSRRDRVEEYYDSVDWSQVDILRQLFQVIEHILQWHFISQDQKENLRQICRDYDLEVEADGWRLSYKDTHIDSDLFKKQFPVGLPFGIAKPNFAITAEEGGQSLKFELRSGMGIIWRDVYPNFEFQSFQAACGIAQPTNLALKKALLAMNQTDYEKDFFKTYARHFGMADNNVPMLVPQAWIQWHSSPKRNLRAIRSSHADELYRVDFVAFWADQRYAILIDDISHYATKRAEQWVADEESYSKRLKEDRTLQAQSWHVFRVSNWEMRDRHKVKEILMALQEFIGF